MQHVEQHIEAIAKTVRSTTEVTATFFDDKVREMGSVTVENGSIAIVLDSFPSLSSVDLMGEFIADSIALAIKACWKEKREAFDKTR